jgi:membrane protease YdiL (CAAX protease family)
MRVFRSPQATVLFTLAAALGLLAIPKIFNLPGVTPVGSKLVRYQLYAWGVALIVMALTLMTHRESALRYLRLNRFAGDMAPVRWLLIKQGENWRRQGWQFAIMLTLVTAAVISQQIPVENFTTKNLFAVLPMAFALALSNSLVEELIFRHSIVSAFDNHRLKKYAPLVSGAIFGCAHYFGAPGGFIGVLMAGFLGWLLAKSMQETGGIFWAWSIHACLDVVIFSAMLLQAFT